MFDHETREKTIGYRKRGLEANLRAIGRFDREARTRGRARGGRWKAKRMPPSNSGSQRVVRTRKCDGSRDEHEHDSRTRFSWN